jgi:phosphoribosylaminoimidazolecarboxamide formyltransferase/IMP cyclohydrolase
MNPTPALPIRRALLSVSDKTGLTDLASDLVAHGVELWSRPAAPRALLREANIAGH